MSFPTTPLDIGVVYIYFTFFRMSIGVVYVRLVLFWAKSSVSQTVLELAA